MDFDTQQKKMQDLNVLSVSELRSEKDDVSAYMVSYYLDFLCKPHPKLGRAGAVCPFVPLAVKFNSLWTRIQRKQTPEHEIIHWLNMFKQRMLDISAEKRLNSAFVLVLPHNSEGDVIDTVQRKVKFNFVSCGLMVGEFHAKKFTEGLHSKDFFPLSTKYSMLAVRSLVDADLPFMLYPMYSNHEKIVYLSHFLKYYPNNQQAKMILWKLKIYNSTFLFWMLVIGCLVYLVKVFCTSVW